MIPMTRPKSALSVKAAGVLSAVNGKKQHAYIAENPDFLRAFRQSTNKLHHCYLYQFAGRQVKRNLDLLDVESPAGHVKPGKTSGISAADLLG